MNAREESYWAFTFGVLIGCAFTLLLVIATVFLEAAVEAEEPRFTEPRCLTIVTHRRL